MRHISAALFGVLALGGGVLAQQAAPPAATGTPEQLANHLAQWEKEMAGVKSISAECRRADVNRVSNNRTELAGLVKIMRVDAGNGKIERLAYLHLADKANPNAYEKFICTGDLVYWFSPREKILYVKKLAAGASDDSFIDFLFQMKVTALMKRYDLTLTRPDDANYVYFEIKPKSTVDKAEFQRARLVLYKRDYLPAQLWFEEPNGNQHTWELTKVRGNDPGVTAKDFVAPEKPTGWELKEMKDKETKGGETEPQKRVVRPAGQ